MYKLRSKLVLLNLPSMKYETIERKIGDSVSHHAGKHSWLPVQVTANDRASFVKEVHVHPIFDVEFKINNHPEYDAIYMEGAHLIEGDSYLSFDVFMLGYQHARLISTEVEIPCLTEVQSPSDLLTSQGMFMAETKRLVQKKYNAALRALGLANKLPDEVDRQKYRARSFGHINRLRAHLKRLEK